MVNCRCSRCYRRKSLPRPPSRYVRKPKCCGLQLHVDHHRMKVEKHPKKTCHCGSYPFPHRMGSLFCEHGPAGVSYYDRRYYDPETRKVRG